MKSYNNLPPEIPFTATFRIDLTPRDPEIAHIIRLLKERNNRLEFEAMGFEWPYGTKSLRGLLEKGNNHG